MFSVPVHFKGNSVAYGFSGGALHADGEVRSTARYFVFELLTSSCSLSCDGAYVGLYI